MPTLLVIEDNDADIMLLEEALAEAGATCELHAITDGGRARQYIMSAQAENDAPDLILLDLNVPAVDGITLLGKIRASTPLKGVPVIVWTSTRARREYKEVLALGVDEFIIKPSGLDEWVAFGNKLRVRLESSSPQQGSNRA